MSKQQEALRLALEALEPRPGMPNPEYESLTQCAITSLREALAEQPAQQCKWPTCQSEEYQQALAEQIKSELVGEKPAQRTWVGLTDEERMDILLALNWDKQLTHMDTAKSIEAKLKEKNNG